MREPPRGMLRNSRAPFSNVRSIRGSRGGNIAIERRRTNTETVRDLRDTDVGVGEHRLGSLEDARTRKSMRLTATESSLVSVGSKHHMRFLNNRSLIPRWGLWQDRGNSMRMLHSTAR